MSSVCGGAGLTTVVGGLVVRGTDTGTVVGATVAGATAGGGTVGAAVVGTVVGSVVGTVVGTACVVGTPLVVGGDVVVEVAPDASTIGVGTEAWCTLVVIPTTMTATSASTIAKSISFRATEDGARRRNGGSDPMSGA